MDIIDAYAHCGIRKYKPYEELDAAMKAGGVSKCVICQHRGEYDHSYIESIVLRTEQGVPLRVAMAEHGLGETEETAGHARRSRRGTHR